MYVYFENLYPKRQSLDALFLINVFKNKPDCCYIMDTNTIRVLTRQMREFSTFNVMS
jgi:hypothetical protein